MTLVGVRGFDSYAGLPRRWSGHVKLPPTNGDSRGPAVRQAVEGIVRRVRFPDGTWVATYRREIMTKYKHAIIAESLRDDPRNEVEAGLQTIHFGRNPDPDYDVLTDDGPKRITHDIVKRIEAPRRMTKDEFKEYIQGEVLPLDDEPEAEA